jgi:hypothetical protein
MPPCRRLAKREQIIHQFEMLGLLPAPVVAAPA